MTRNLVPNLIVKSIHDITPGLLKKIGVEGMLVDLDNTLASYSEKEPNENIIQWVREISQHDIKVGIISNNNQQRVDLFNEKLGLSYNTARAKKPFRKSFIDIAANMGLPPEKIAVVGDQIYTDVLGGNSVGMYTIMVDSRKTWNALLALRRLLEEPFISLYKRRKKRCSDGKT